MLFIETKTFTFLIPEVETLIIHKNIWCIYEGRLKTSYCNGIELQILNEILNYIFFNLTLEILININPKQIP